MDIWKELAEFFAAKGIKGSHTEGAAGAGHIRVGDLAEGGYDIFVQPFDADPTIHTESIED